MMLSITLLLSLLSIANGLTESNGVTRRKAIYLSGGISGLLSPSLKSANAAGQPGLGYEAYSILTDSSADLNPSLESINPAALVKSVAQNKKGGAVWLGEHHNAVKDHQFQVDFIKSLLLERKKGKINPPMAIGLEQIQIQFQSVLDDYISGKISLQEMRKGVDWEKRWSWDFEGYRPIFETAKKLNIQLVALNVDSEDLSLVEKGGYPGLPIKQLRKYIKDPIGFGAFAKTRQFSTYVEYVIQPSYKIHQQLGLLKYTSSGDEMAEETTFSRFLSGRMLWDEGMASQASNWCSANPGGLMVGLVGADHVKFRNGIPSRFARQCSPGVDCTSVIINPTTVDSRPSRSVASLSGSVLSQDPNDITLQLRYLKDEVDPNSDVRSLPESTGGVLGFSDYIIITA